MASVGNNIKRLRTAQKMTQETLAEKLFVTRQAVSAWETGKALPDVETLDRIAAALGCTVIEVIYGVASPDVKRLRKRWLITGAAMAAAIALLVFAMEQYGVLGTLCYGLRYQFWNQDYDVVMEELPESYSVELDLNDPGSNVGKVLYEDDAGCRITVERVDASANGRHRVTFTAEGVCSSMGGQLVSGCHNVLEDKQTYHVALAASMRTTVGTVQYPENHYYTQSSLDNDGNFFGFFLFPAEFYKSGDLTVANDLAAADNKVIVTVSGLMRLTTTRVNSPFG